MGALLFSQSKNGHRDANLFLLWSYDFISDDFEQKTCCIKTATREVNFVVVDRSMMNVGQEDVNDRTGDRAFDDETDLKNEDFIFIY